MLQFSFKSLLGSKSHRKEWKDVLYLICLQGVNKVLPLVVLPYLLIHLTAKGYGYVGFSFSVAQIIVLIIDFGFDLTATKAISVSQDNKKELNLIFWSVVWSKIILMTISFLILSLLTFTVPVFKLYSIAIFCSLPMCIGSAFTFMWFYQGIGKVRTIAIINTAAKLLILPLIFIFIQQESDYLKATLIQSSVFLFTAVVSCLWLTRYHLVQHVVFSWHDIKKTLTESLPIFLSKASTSIYTQLFVIVLGFLTTEEIVGKYSSAEAIMRAFCFVLYVPITQAFYPKISALSISNKTEGIRLFFSLRKAVFIVMGLVSFFLLLTSNYLPLILGTSYKGIENLLIIMSPAPVFIGLGAVYGQMGLLALGDNKARIKFRNSYFIVGVCAILFVALLAPLFYDIGAAIALLLSEILVCFLMYYFTKRAQILSVTS